ncbi:MAG: HIRAN domain-containing protein [Gemmatimonadales bacterium]
MNDVPGRTRRVSITKLQRATAAATELIALCQSVTADGSLADDEVQALREWLQDNAAVDLPARDFLFATVKRILEDGQVTMEERRELYLAIEKALPADLRDDVRGKRVDLEREEKERQREARENAEAAARDARLLNMPIRRWNFMVAGVRHEGRPQIIGQHTRPGDDVFAVRDTENRFSRNAVQIRLANGMQIGFVPEQDAAEMASLLDAGHGHAAWITKVLTGGRSPIPVVQAEIYPLGATAPAVYQRDVPPLVAAPGLATRSGCGTAAGIVIILGWAATALA